MKTLQRRAPPRCPIKRHDVKWPCDAPVVSFGGLPSLPRSSRFRLLAEAWFCNSNLSLMRRTCPEGLVNHRHIAGKGMPISSNHANLFANLTDSKREAPAITPVAMVTNVTITMIQPQ